MSELRPIYAAMVPRMLPDLSINVYARLLLFTLLEFFWGLIRSPTAWWWVDTLDKARWQKNVHSKKETERNRRDNVRNFVRNVILVHYDLFVASSVFMPEKKYGIFEDLTIFNVK